MKIVDLTPLKNNDTEYERLTASVSEHYKVGWDDAVHDSYGVYVNQVEERSRSIRVQNSANRHAGYRGGRHAKSGANGTAQAGHYRTSRFGLGVLFSASKRGCLPPN